MHEKRRHAMKVSATHYIALGIALALLTPVTLATGGDDLASAQVSLGEPCDSHFEGCQGAQSSFTLQPPIPGIAGERNEFITIDGTPNTGVVLYLGGVGTSPVTVGPCTTFVEVRSARFFAAALADDDGRTVLTRSVPAGFQGVPVRIQALDVRTCTTSNLVETVFE